MTGCSSTVPNCAGTLPTAGTDTVHLPRLGEDPQAPFPPVDAALADPPGLLAWGGDLSLPRLLAAYRHGIFPWYSRGQPILWWSPDPRLVLRPSELHIARRLRRSLRNSGWRIAADSAFAKVLDSCAGAPRPDQHGTWITADMRRAYLGLHAAGHAHSVEAWDRDGALAGGIYGVRIGRMFFGESMFSAQSGGSKVALAALCHAMMAAGMPLLDCQVASPHLLGLGARCVGRDDFQREVVGLVERPVAAGWPRKFLPEGAAQLG